ncbi:MAG TPA: hypothetical protein VF041_15195 [Gemmatimonadaceae bacterium]
MLTALVRELDEGFAPTRAESRHLPPNAHLRREQRYLHETLEACGVRAAAVGAASSPDDLRILAGTLVLDEVLFAPACRAANDPLVEWLARGRDLVSPVSPGLLDGRNVLAVDRRLFLGVPEGTPASTFRAAARTVAAYGYEVAPVPLSGCDHLRQVSSYVGRGIVLADPRHVEPRAFGDLDVLAVGGREPFAASVLFADPIVIVSSLAAREAVAHRGLPWTSVSLRTHTRAMIAISELAIIIDVVDDDESPTSFAQSVGVSRSSRVL